MKQLFQCIITACLSVFSLTSQAQSVRITNINGVVSAAKQVIEGASVNLLRAEDSAVISKTVTGNAGDFHFDEKRPGKYLVSVQFVGFSNYFSETFEINEEKFFYEVKPISLIAGGQQLVGVTVTSKKPFIEQKLDKTIVNVEASPTNTGLTVLEVLEKSPGVSVDKDGNVSLRGKQGVLILVDGKPTYLSGADLANMLKNMPSANVEQMEIMTNPPAKYDAAGNSGIINIKTKKSKAKGMNGSVTLGGGKGIEPKANESFNINYRAGKVNLFANYSYNWNKGFQDLDLTRIFRDETTGDISTIFRQHSDMSKNFQRHTYKLGMDYYATNKTTVGFALTGYSNPGTFSSNTVSDIYNGNEELQAVTESISSSNEKWKNFGANFNLRHQFDTAGTEITADLDYLNYSSNLNQLFNNYFYNPSGGKIQPDEILRGTLPGDITIYSGKADFTKSLKHGIKLEAGVKSSYVKTDNNALYENYIDDQWQVDSGKTNHFIYTENINAAYVNLNKQLSKKWSAQAGLRLENTIADGNQLTTGETFKRNYTQLFPTAFIGYTLSEKNQFSLSYGRRINRPDYSDLNPFYYFLDKYTYEVGNPYLKPQFSHNIEVGHSFKGVLNTTLGFTGINDMIQQVLVQDDSTNTTYITQSNIAKQRSISLSVNANMPVTKWWRTNIYTQFVYNEYSGYVNKGPLEVSGPGFMTNISNQFTLKKGWGLELSGFFRSKMVDGIIVAEPMGVVNFGASKSVLKNKGSIKINFRDFLDIQQFNGYSRYQNIDATIHNEWDNRVLNVSFTYRFSKGKAGAAPRKQSSSAEEQNRVKGARD